MILQLKAWLFNLGIISPNSCYTVIHEINICKTLLHTQNNLFTTNGVDFTLSNLDFNWIRRKKGY